MRQDPRSQSLWRQAEGKYSYGAEPYQFQVLLRRAQHVETSWETHAEQETETENSNPSGEAMRPRRIQSLKVRQELVATIAIGANAYLLLTLEAGHSNEKVDWSQKLPTCSLCAGKWVRMYDDVITGKHTVLQSND